MKTNNTYATDERQHLKSNAFTRRKFIASCSACAACAALAPVSLMTQSCSSSSGSKKLKIRVIYSLHAPVQAQPDWPNVGYNFNPDMDFINSALAKRFPEIGFMSAMAKNEAEAERIAAHDEAAGVDGYIVYQMNCWNQVVQSIAKTGKPVIYADFQFGGSGGFLVYNAAFLRNKTPNVGFVASSRIDDLLSAVSCFKEVEKNAGSDFASLVAAARFAATKPAGSFTPAGNNLTFLDTNETIRRLANSRILAVRDQKSEKAAPLMGIPVEYIPFSEVNAAWSKANRDESAMIVERWKKTALSVEGVNDETLLTSAAMYLGMKDVLKQHGANAITINCLGGFYGGHIHAYPCLGFHELNNEGLVGGCECDVRSAATMLAFSTMTNGRPGYISDPVIDTSKRQIIYSHCVAPNKVFGPAGESNPFRILTHSEDRSGASIRSILPVNYLTTTMQIDAEKKEILFHQATVVGNDPDDRACRTKICAEPAGDIEKLFTMWDSWGWHRVTFYGDMKNNVEAFADAIGWKIVREA
jgi:hypothetical protein